MRRRIYTDYPMVYNYPNKIRSKQRSDIFLSAVYYTIILIYFNMNTQRRQITVEIFVHIV